MATIRQLRGIRCTDGRDHRGRGVIRLGHVSLPDLCDRAARPARASLLACGTSSIAVDAAAASSVRSTASAQASCRSIAGCSIVCSPSAAAADRRARTGRPPAGRVARTLRDVSAAAAPSRRARVPEPTSARRRHASRRSPRARRTTRSTPRRRPPPRAAARAVGAPRSTTRRLRAADRRRADVGARVGRCARGARSPKCARLVDELYEQARAELVRASARPRS